MLPATEGLESVPVADRRGLYIHVPFCVRRCLYCDFYLETPEGSIADRLENLERTHRPIFLEGIEQELRQLPANFAPRSIYLGGGTPTELSLDDLKQLFDLLHAHIDMSRVVEWTIEANPGTLSREKAAWLLASGVNRFSLGVQSLDDKQLEFIGRIHRAADSLATTEMLRELGVTNLNLDLIINLPDTSSQHLERELDRLMSLKPEHCSCYALEWHPDTPLTQLRNRGYVEELPDEISEAQYRALERLTEADLQHYELFNYARPGFESQHNQNYWLAGEYFGLGPSACSHWGGRRWQQHADLSKWIQSLRRGETACCMSETLAVEPRAREILMTSIRQIRGVSLVWFAATTGFDLVELGGEILQRQIDEGWMILEDGRLHMHPDAWFISNRILSELI